MKVVYLLGSLNRGGTETLMVDVLRNANTYGLNASCFYRKGGACENDLKKSQAKVIQIKPGKNVLSYLFRLRKALKDEKADVVHAMQGIDTIYGWIASFNTGIKVVQTLHGFDFDNGIIDKVITRLSLKLSDKNIYVSSYQSRYYIDKYTLSPSKQDVVYNGISFDKIHTAVIPDCEFREEFQLPENVMLMGMVGNFNSVRDHLTVCRFLKLLNESGADFRFLFIGKRIVGQESFYDACVEFCESNNFSDKVIFAGMRQDVPAILNQLDCFVYSTAHDTFGIAVVEAMAVGIPVFVNDWFVMKEITDDGRYAIMYKSGEEEDLYEQYMEYVQSQKKMMQKLKDAARYAQQTFSIESHVNALKMQYTQLIEK